MLLGSIISWCYKYLAWRSFDLLYKKSSFSTGKVLSFGWLDSSNIFSSASVKTLSFHWLSLDLWMPCLLNQLVIQKFRLETSWGLVSLKFLRLVSLGFSPFVINFLSLLLSIILISYVSICPYSLFLRQESSQWHGKMELSLINVSGSNLKTNLLKLKILDLIILDFYNV